VSLAAQITEYSEPCRGVIIIAAGATGGNDATAGIGATGNNEE